VDHRSFWLDLEILVMTVKRVFSGSGVTQVGHATTEKFRGTADG
jgi:sugar transferase EpsL